MRIWMVAAVVFFTLGFFLEPHIACLCQKSTLKVLEPFCLVFLGLALVCLGEMLRRFGGPVPTWHKAILQLQHVFNPLHLYCYLVGKGLDKKVSILICKSYEKLLFVWANRLSLFLDDCVTRSR